MPPAVAGAPEWKQGRPRILVADAWLANTGDGAIALATHERLRRLAPEAAIVHAAYQADLVGPHYPDLDFVPPLAALVGVTKLIPEMSGWDLSACERFVGEADVVLSQGGGFAMEHYDPWERLRAWELVVERGLTFGLGAQSVGRFTRPRERAILRRVYEAAAVVAVRDPQSLEHVTELGAPPERVLLSADEAFSLRPARPVPRWRRRGIACVLSRHPWLSADGGAIHPGRAIEAQASLVSELLRSSGRQRVTLLSTQQGLGSLERGLEDDAEFAAKVVESLSRREARRVRIVSDYLSPLRFAELVARHRGLVSMRMHPVILALTCDVPSVLITQAFKATAMFEMLGLSAALVDDPAEAPARLALLDRLDIDYARRRAAVNDEVVSQLLGRSSPSEPQLAGGSPQRPTRLVP